MYKIVQFQVVSETEYRKESQYVLYADGTLWYRWHTRVRPQPRQTDSPMSQKTTQKPRTRKFYAFTWLNYRGEPRAIVEHTLRAARNTRRSDDGLIVPIELPLPEVRRGK